MQNIIKQILSFTFVLFSLIGCNFNLNQNQANESQSVNGSEVVWSAGTVDEALANAKAANKLLFVECYSPTCPICQSLEPYFKEAEVAKTFNNDFVNYKLDVGNAEMVKFLNDRNIYLPSFPQFLFFDTNGKLVHQGEVTPNVKDFVNIANRANNKTERAENYPKMLAEGNKNLDFLIAYANYARIIKDTTANLSVANQIFEIYPKEQLGSEESWKITKKCVTDMENGFAKYWFDHIKEAAEFENKEGHQGNDKNILSGIIQSSLYSPRGKNYNTTQLAQVKTNMAKIGAGEYADGVTWEFECKALVKEGKPAEALPIADKIAAKFITNGPSLVYITHVFNEIYPNNAYFPRANKWLATAKPLLNEDKYLVEYYYELAMLNKKAGKIAEAKSAATEGKKYALKAQLDLSKFNAF